MLTLASLEARVSPGQDHPHPRHALALPLLRDLRSRCLGLAPEDSLSFLDHLEERLRSAHPLSVPPDGPAARRQLCALRNHFRRVGGDAQFDLASDVLLILFGPHTYPLSAHCEGVLPHEVILSANLAFFHAMAEDRIDSCLHSADTALAELSYALGYNHTDLQTWFRASVTQARSTGGTWLAEESHLTRVFPLYDGFRYRIRSEYGAHAVRLLPPETGAKSLDWAPIYGRLGGRCTVVGFDEGFWGKR